jgi:hypothetical protein
MIRSLTAVALATGLGLPTSTAAQPAQPAYVQMPQGSQMMGQGQMMSGQNAMMNDPEMRRQMTEMRQGCERMMERMNVNRTRPLRR